MKECQLCRYFIILVISRTFVYLIFQGRIYKVAIVKLWILFFFTAFASYVWNVIKSCKYIFYLKRSRWTSLYALTIISTLETLFLSYQKSPHRCILQRSSWPILYFEPRIPCSQLKMLIQDTLCFHYTNLSTVEPCSVHRLLVLGLCNL